MKKHFEIIDYNAFITWEVKTKYDNTLMLIGTLYWCYSDMDDNAGYEAPLVDLKEFDSVKEMGRELLMRKYKHQSITE